MRKRLKMTVLYDNWCPLCIQVKNNIEKLDWFNLIHLKGFRGLEKDLKIPKSDLEEKMHVILFNNKIVSGYEAFVSISLRIPLLSFFWPLLKFFGLIGIGSKIYNIIAKNRKIIPTGHCNNEDSCDIE